MDLQISVQQDKFHLITGFTAAKLTSFNELRLRKDYIPDYNRVIKLINEDELKTSDTVILETFDRAGIPIDRNVNVNGRITQMDSVYSKAQLEEFGKIDEAHAELQKNKRYRKIR